MVHFGHGFVGHLQTGWGRFRCEKGLDWKGWGSLLVKGSLQMKWTAISSDFAVISALLPRAVVRRRYTNRQQKGRLQSHSLPKGISAVNASLSESNSWLISSRHYSSMPQSRKTIFWLNPILPIINRRYTILFISKNLPPCSFCIAPRFPGLRTRRKRCMFSALPSSFELD